MRQKAVRRFSINGWNEKETERDGTHTQWARKQAGKNKLKSESSMTYPDDIFANEKANSIK